MPRILASDGGAATRPPTERDKPETFVSTTQARETTGPETFASTTQARETTGWRSDDAEVVRVINALRGVILPPHVWEDEDEEPTLRMPWETDVKPGDQELASAALTSAGDVVRDERDPKIPSFPGGFDLAAWQAQFENGRIPQSALLRVPGTDHLMEPNAAFALASMINAATRDGVVLGIGNTYRDYAGQVAAYQRYQSGQGALAADPGTSVHGWGLAVDFNITPQNHAWLVENAARFGFSNPFGTSFDAVENWHWEYGVSGSAPDFNPENTSRERARRRGKKVDPLPADGGLMGASLLANEGRYDGDALAEVAYAIATQRAGQEPALPSREVAFKGVTGSIKKQLYQGFMSAGRPDLAAMVGTKEFDIWIRQESGWRPDATSPANNNGLANDGLFQVWRGHPFNSRGQVASMSPYEQARLIARNFSHLDPSDIRRYAAAIQAGTYSGWG